MDLRTASSGSRDVNPKQILLEAAIQAPSPNNQQPWKFSWSRGQLLLFLDEARAHGVFDAAHFSAYLGLGCVLENISIAAAHLGYSIKLSLSPERDQHNPTAAISFLRGLAVAQPLYPAIAERCTNRRPYESEPVPSRACAELMHAAAEWPQFRLTLMTSKERIKEIANLIAHADRIRFNFSIHEIHRDFFIWLRYTEREAMETGDGLWVRCLEINPFQVAVLRFLSSWQRAMIAAKFGVSWLFSANSMRLMKQTPLMAIVTAIGYPQLFPSDLLQAGRFCQRLWLTATSQGLACQPLGTLPAFLEKYATQGEQSFPGDTGAKVQTVQREFVKLMQLSPQEHPIMLLRLGYSPAPSVRSVRRPPRAVLISDDGSPIAC